MLLFTFTFGGHEVKQYKNYIEACYKTFTRYILTAYKLCKQRVKVKCLSMITCLESALRYDVCVRQEGLVKKLFTWAREAERPLNIYATGLLARAMSNQEVAASYGEENAQLVGQPVIHCTISPFYKYSLYPQHS